MIYTVRQNQNLFDVATQIYGDISKAVQIMRENGLAVDFRLPVDTVQVDPVRQGNEPIKRVMVRYGVIVAHGFEGGRVLATEQGQPIEFPGGIFISI